MNLLSCPPSTLTFSVLSAGRVLFPPSPRVTGQGGRRVICTFPVSPRACLDPLSPGVYSCQVFTAFTKRAVTPFVIITFQRLTMDHLPLLNILEPHYCHSKLEAHCAGQIRYLHRARE